MTTTKSRKAAIVTGAGRMIGIGRSAALRLAADGYDVAVAARPRGALPEKEQAAGWRGAESVADEVRAMGRRAIAVECDVTKPDQVDALVEQSVAAFGGITALVNNAALAGNDSLAPVVKLEETAWREMIDVNLNGLFLMSKAASRAMIDGGQGGAIVNISSLAGRYGMANFGAYCVSKFGVIAFTQQLALELARYNIRVNCVCPGATETEMFSDIIDRSIARKGGAGEQVRGQIAKTIPLGRIGSPEDQANAIAFFVSDQASFVTGQSLNVDGGQRMD